MTKHHEFFSIEEAERRAERRLPRVLFAALKAGSEAGVTSRDNEEAFHRVGFRPRAATVFDSRDLTTTVLGKEVALPVLVAPIGKVRIVHPDGALAGARATTDLGTISVVTSGCGHTIEQVGAAAGSGRVWLQVSAWKDRDDLEAVMARAHAAGFEGLVLTVDASVSPNPPVGRPVKIDLYNALHFGPQLIARPPWFANFVRDGMDLSLASVVSTPKPGAKGPLRPTWNDFKWIKESWPRALIAKGVVTSDDALRAVDSGVDGVIVSNHGGKSLDGAPATFRALPFVLEAVGSDVDVLLDGGVRRGGDVVKAVAMGAKAVLIGRPFVWGLAAGGEAGVRNVFDVFREGIARTLGLIGCPSIDSLDRSFLDL